LPLFRDGNGKMHLKPVLIALVEIGDSLGPSKHHKRPYNRS
jgi:hypothetical protein